MNKVLSRVIFSIATFASMIAPASAVSAGPQSLSPATARQMLNRHYLVRCISKDAFENGAYGSARMIANERMDTGERSRLAGIWYTNMHVYWLMSEPKYEYYQRQGSGDIYTPGVDTGYLVRRIEGVTRYIKFSFQNGQRFAESDRFAVFKLSTCDHVPKVTILDTTRDPNNPKIVRVVYAITFPSMSVLYGLRTDGFGFYWDPNGSNWTKYRGLISYVMNRPPSSQLTAVFQRLDATGWQLRSVG